MSPRGAHADALSATLARSVHDRAAIHGPILQRDWWTDLKEGVSTTVLSVTGTEAERVEFEHEKLSKRLPRWPNQSRRDVADELELLPPRGNAAERTRLRAVVDILGEPETMLAEPRAADLISAASLAEVIAILVSAGCAPAAAFRLARSWNLVLKNLLPDLVKVRPMTIDLIRAVIVSASESERRATWSDRVALDKVRDADPSLDKTLYLGVLPAVGIEAPSLKGSSGEKARISPPDIDRYIRKYLPTIGQNVPSSRTVIGQISVVDRSDFQWAYERQWLNSGKYTTLAKRGEDQCKAFVDVDLPGRHIWISAHDASEGTPVHEGMHKYADDKLRNEMRPYSTGGAAGISMLDEGLTEYFTRKACTLNGLTRYPGYPPQHEVAELIVAKLGRGVLADAYYQGKYDELVLEFERVTKNKWADFATALEQFDYPEAKRLIG